MTSRLTDKINIRSTNVDVIKFFCAIAVIVCHSYAVTQGKGDFVESFTEGQCNLGGLAVAVFFLFSGLYVTKSYDKQPELRGFIKRRCKRIFPQLWFVVCLSVLCGLLLSRYSAYDYLTNARTYLYLLNGILIPVHNLPGVFEGMPYQTVNGPLWTLPVEVFCYIGLVILAKLSYRFKSDRFNRRAWDVVAFLLLLIAFAIAEITTESPFVINIIRPMVVFYEGALFYDFREELQLRPVASMAGVLLLLLFAYTPFFNFGVIVLLPYCVLTFALGLAQVKISCGVFQCSYEMYLVGWPIQQFAVYELGRVSPLVNCLIAIPADILIGWTIFKIFEGR